MELFKKLFAGVTVVAMAMITVAPAGFANAATMTDGDLIKKASSSAVYYYSNGKRYVFPTESTYKTWYADFSKVKTIESAELSAIPLGGNVTFRPGTNLVKITTDPKVYAVSPNGTLHWVKSEAAAKTLFGNDWAKMVKDVPDGFFTNYTVSSTDLDGTKHVPGQVIKYNGSDKMYYITSDWKKREFTGSSFAMNGFQSMYVVTSPDSITYPNGDDISGAEMMLWDAAQKATSGQNNNNTTGNGTLSVALAADTPASDDIPAGSTAARNVEFTKLNFTAGGDDVKVTRVKIKREGLSQDSDLSNVKLFDKNGAQVGTAQSFDANHVATFIIDWTVKAGMTESLFVKGDSAASKTGRIKLGLVDADSIVSNAKSVSGSFPIFGNTMEQVNVSVGQVSITKGASDPTTTTADVDDKALRVHQMRLQANSTEKVEINSVTYRFGDNASVSTTEIENVVLKDDKNNKTYTASRTGEYYRFDFSPAIMLDKGANVDLSLHVDVLGGSSKIIQFDPVEDEDWLVEAKGLQYGYGVSISPTPTAAGLSSASLDFDSNTASEQTASEPITVNAGTLNVTEGANTPATGNIALGGDDVKIAAFEFDVRGEDMKVGSTAIDLTGASGLDVNTEATLYKLVDKDGKVWAGPNDASAGTVTFSTQMVFPIGKTELFLTANITSDSSAVTSGSSSIYASLNPSTDLTSVKGMTSNRAVTPTPNATVQTNTMTVEAAALVATMGGSPIAGSYVIGGKDFHLATLRFKATAEDVNLNSVSVGEGTFGTAVEMSDDFTNFKLWYEGKQVGETEQSSSSNVVTFNIDETFVIKENATVELKMTADVTSTVDATADTVGLAAGQTATFDITTASGVGMSSGSTAEDTSVSNASQEITWQTAGVLKVSKDANSPVATFLSSGSTGVEMARYKFTALYEDVDVTQLNFYAGNSATAASVAVSVTSAATPIDTSIKNVHIYNGTTLLGTTVIDNLGKFSLDLNAGELRILKDENTVISVKADLASKSSLGSNTPVAIGLADSNGVGTAWLASAAAENYDIDAVGKSSGSTIGPATINSAGAASGIVEGGNLMTLFDGVLTVSLNPNSPSGNFTAGNATEVLRIDLTATGDDITIGEIYHTFSGTCDLTGGGATSAAYWRSADNQVDYFTYASGTAWLSTAYNTNANSTYTNLLQIGAGETKTIKLVGDTSATAACTSDETLQYAIESDGTSGHATATENPGGIEWYDGELYTAAGGTKADLWATTGVANVVTDTTTRTIPLYGNTLKI